MPVAAVRSEERTKCCELEPANEKLSGVVGRPIKSADVRSPQRQAREARVDRDRDVRLERLPPRLDVAGPDETTEPLNARGRIAMQRIRTFVRTIQLRALPVHAMPIQLRRPIEPVALIRPPAVDANVHERFMKRPVA